MIEFMVPSVLADCIPGLRIATVECGLGCIPSGWLSGGVDVTQAARRVWRCASGAQAFASTSFNKDVCRRNSRGRAVIASVK